MDTVCSFDCDESRYLTIIESVESSGQTQAQIMTYMTVVSCMWT